MNIVYPLETKKRELDGVLLLASELIKQGHQISLGPKRELNYQINNIKPHLFIASNASFNEDYQNLFSHLKKMNSLIVVMDTEGGVIIDDIYKKRHHSDMLEFCDLFFAWGGRGKELIEEATNFDKEKIIVTGVPWFEILKNRELLLSTYTNEIEQITKEYGDNFLLYNSRFSGNNFFNKYIESEVKNNYADNEYYEYSNSLFENLNSAIKRIAEHFPNEKIIVRPHPSESNEFYKEFFKSYSNVFVDDRFNVRPWLLASRLMFHNGCTTAIESAIMGKPTLSLMEIKNPEFDIQLPNDSSEQFESVDRLINRIDELISKPINYQLSENQINSIYRYIANIKDNSLEIIANEINKLNPNKIKAIHSLKYYKQFAKTFILNNHRSLIKTISQKKFEKLDSFYQYSLNKFPNLKKEEVEEKLTYFMNGKAFEVTPISGTNNCFTISNKAS